MVKYHISKRTGKASKCFATTTCPFGDLETEHYETQAEARAAYEERMKEHKLPSFKNGEIKVSKLPKYIRLDSNVMKIPRGLYVLGDPSIIAGKDPQSWMSWKKTITEDGDGFKNSLVGASYNNFPVVAAQVPVDAAIFYDNNGKSYGVQQGMIGLVPLSLAKKLKATKDEIEEESHIINFTDDTIVEFDNDKGVIYFGENLSIRVEPDTEEDGEDDYFPEDTETFDEFSDEDRASYEAEYNRFLRESGWDDDSLNNSDQSNSGSEDDYDEDYENFLKELEDLRVSKPWSQPIDEQIPDNDDWSWKN